MKRRREVTTKVSTGRSENNSITKPMSVGTMKGVLQALVEALHKKDEGQQEEVILLNSKNASTKKRSDGKKEISTEEEVEQKEQEENKNTNNNVSLKLFPKVLASVLSGFQNVASYGGNETSSSGPVSKLGINPILELNSQKQAEALTRLESLVGRLTSITTTSDKASNGKSRTNPNGTVEEVHLERKEEGREEVKKTDQNDEEVYYVLLRRLIIRLYYLAPQDSIMNFLMSRMLQKYFELTLRRKGEEKQHDDVDDDGLFTFSDLQLLAPTNFIVALQVTRQMFDRMLYHLSFTSSASTSISNFLHCVEEYLHFSLMHERLYCLQVLILRNEWLNTIAAAEMEGGPPKNYVVGENTVKMSLNTHRRKLALLQFLLDRLQSTSESLAIQSDGSIVMAGNTTSAADATRRGGAGSSGMSASCLDRRYEDMLLRLDIPGRKGNANSSSLFPKNPPMVGAEDHSSSNRVVGGRRQNENFQQLEAEEEMKRNKSSSAYSTATHTPVTTAQLHHHSSNSAMMNLAASVSSKLFLQDVFGAYNFSNVVGRRKATTAVVSVSSQPPMKKSGQKASGGSQGAPSSQAQRWNLGGEAGQGAVSPLGLNHHPVATGLHQLNCAAYHAAGKLKVNAQTLLLLQHPPGENVVISTRASLGRLFYLRQRMIQQPDSRPLLLQEFTQLVKQFPSVNWLSEDGCFLEVLLQEIVKAENIRIFQLSPPPSTTSGVVSSSGGQDNNYKNLQCLIFLLAHAEAANNLTTGRKISSSSKTTTSTMAQSVEEIASVLREAFHLRWEEQAVRRFLSLINPDALLNGATTSLKTRISRRQDGEVESTGEGKNAKTSFPGGQKINNTDVCLTSTVPTLKYSAIAHLLVLRLIGNLIEDGLLRQEDRFVAPGMDYTWNTSNTATTGSMAEKEERGDGGFLEGDNDGESGVGCGGHRGAGGLGYDENTGLRAERILANRLFYLTEDDGCVLSAMLEATTLISKRRSTDFDGCDTEKKQKEEKKSNGRRSVVGLTDFYLVRFPHLLRAWYLHLIRRLQPLVTQSTSGDVSGSESQQPLRLELQQVMGRALNRLLFFGCHISSSSFSSSSSMPTPLSTSTTSLEEDPTVESQQSLPPGENTTFGMQLLQLIVADGFLPTWHPDPLREFLVRFTLSLQPPYSFRFSICVLFFIQDVIGHTDGKLYQKLRHLAAHCKYQLDSGGGSPGISGHQTQQDGATPSPSSAASQLFGNQYQTLVKPRLKELMLSLRGAKK